MPRYEFRDPKTGEVFEVFRSVSERDKPVTLERLPVPSRLGIMAAGIQEPTMTEKLRGAYHKLEQQDGTRFKSGFKPNKLKKVLDGAISEGR